MSGPSRRLRVLNAVLRRTVKPHGAAGLERAEVDRARRRLERATRTARTPGTHEQRVTVGGVPAAWYRREGSRTDAALVWFHGGAYVSGSTRTHRELFHHLVVATGVPVLGVDYRLAPEWGFPAWLDDATTSFGVVADHLGADRVVVGGDSAGGGLTLALLQHLRALGRPQPAAAVALSPWTDLAGLGASRHTNADADPMLDPARLDALGRALLGDHPPTHPLLSPAFGDFTGCAPLLVQVGTTEVLLDDARAVRDAYERAGAPVRYTEVAEAPHVYPAFARFLPEGAQGIAEIADHVGAHLPPRAG